MLEVRGGLLSLLSSLGVPYVWNSCWQININLDVVAWPGTKWTCQFVYLHRKVFNVPDTICWKGHFRDVVTVMGSCGWLGAMVAQIEQFTLKFHIDAFIPGQYMESLAWALMPSSPWWVECSASVIAGSLYLLCSSLGLLVSKEVTPFLTFLFFFYLFGLLKCFFNIFIPSKVSVLFDKILKW